MIPSIAPSDPVSLRMAEVTMTEKEASSNAASSPDSAPARQPGQVRILFLVMSAVAQPGTIDQLAQALAPHQVLVHHDFSQRPAFSLTAPNVVMVPEPKRTGWGDFGFVEGIFHAMQYALENLSFDYLQLLSPACLPIKPMAAFEQHVAQGAPAHFDGLELLQDGDALMSVGYRAFTVQHTLLHRLARRLPNWYYGNSAGRRHEAGIWLRSSAGGRPLVDLARRMTSAVGRFVLGRQSAVRTLPLYYGSTWFGARRQVVQGMVRAFSQPALHAYFSQLSIAEEFLIPSLLMQLTAGQKGPLNHFIQVFDQAHPGWFDMSDFAQLKASPAFFARKFKDNPLAPVRLRVLAELAVRAGEQAAANAPDYADAPSVKPAAVLPPHGQSQAPGLAA